MTTTITKNYNYKMIFQSRWSDEDGVPEVTKEHLIDINDKEMVRNMIISYTKLGFALVSSYPIESYPPDEF